MTFYPGIYENMFKATLRIYDINSILVLATCVDNGTRSTASPKLKLTWKLFKSRFHAYINYNSKYFYFEFFLKFQIFVKYYQDLFGIRQLRSSLLIK